ncbi:mitochondrial inner membrane protein Mitofilin [Melanogaster broomeanus]|nr:mitochondrial inner membrane protein Mitofilin [Melanogaster broomeanus]
MYRAISVPKQAAGRGLVRATRRRLVSTTTPTPIPNAAPPAPKNTKSIARKLVFYSVTATGTFYIGSTFVSFENQQYRELFTKYVPLGAALVEYGEAHQWDDLTVQQVIVTTVDAAKAVSSFVQKQLGYAPEDRDAKAEERKDAPRGRVKSALHETKERVKSTAAALKTAVDNTKDEASEETAKATAIAKHRAAQFADELDDLIKKAEAALAGKPVDSIPEAILLDQPPPDTAVPASNEVEIIIVSESPDKKIYSAPLPIGFEPPPGFSRPSPPKPASKATSPADLPAPVPLPLVAVAVSDVAISEPVISHLASTIDNLASYLRSNPAVAEKARDVLETAKDDLTQLASRFEKIREDEQRQLEAKLDEQAREYTTKLLELEIEAQDKLDLQKEDIEKFVEEEKARYAQAYREKLDNELKVQTDLINERLKEEVIAQGIELQRRWIREVKVKVEEERGGRLAKLDELATNLKRLERLALDNSSYLDENIRVHGMWTALRAIQAAFDAPIRKPFREELRILRHTATAKDDAVVSAALESLENSDTPDIGVEPFADLASWFATSVVPRVSSVALVPDQDAGVLSHLASHLLSSLRFQRHGLTPGSDVLSVLSRAEYYLNEKDLDGAARELNQLSGTAKELLHDWLEAARRRLEVQQALEVMQTQATLASLLVV